MYINVNKYYCNALSGYSERKKSEYRKFVKEILVSASHINSPIQDSFREL